MSTPPLVENEAVLMRHEAGGVATLTLNRPDQFNSLSTELLTGLQAALDAIAQDVSVRVVVIEGAGKAFCAGHDLKQMRANHDKDYMRRLFAQCGKVMMTLMQMPQPVQLPSMSFQSHDMAILLSPP